MMRSAKALFVLTLLTAAVATIYAKTLVWGDFDGGVPMSDADAAYQACPDDGYPQSGNDLTPCQVAWYNGGF